MLSGEDLRQLVKLQGQAQDIGVTGACTDTWMAELAGALGAGVVIATQAGKLGDTFVVTLAVFDAAKAKSVSRRSIQAANIGELPAKLGPALDALMQPLVATLTPATTATATIPNATAKTTTSPTTTNAPMTGRLAELYGVEAMQICTSQKDPTVWWFCTTKSALTENAFVYRYRDVTGGHDIDRADVNRASTSIALPIGLFILSGAGVVVLGGTVVCATTDTCGSDVKSALGKDQGSLAVAPAMLGTGAFVGGLVGGILTLPTEEDVDGKPEMHTLTEGEGRAAVARYNEALRAKLERDLGGAS